MTAYKKQAALFLASQGVSLFGSSLVSFAIIWYVTLETSSGVWVSVLTVASFVPQFFISFFSGVWADRYPRKRLIILSDLVIAGATLALASLIPALGEGKPMLGALVVISVIRSLGTGVQMPAVNAAIPQLVPEDKLMRFNGINAAIQSVVRFAAPAAAGAVLSFGTLQETLLIDVTTAIIGVGILSAVALPFVPAETSPPVLSEMVAGFRYALRERFLGRLLLTFALFIFLCVPAGFLASLFVSRYYGDSYWYLTIVEVVGFLGMTGGGLLIGLWGGFENRVKTLALGTCAFGALAVAMGAVDSFGFYLAMMALYGVALTMVETSSTTLLQENSAPEMRGRMFGLNNAMYAGALPLGMAFFGPLSDVVSLRLLMVVAGLLLLFLSLALLMDRSFYLHRRKETQ